MMLKVKDQISLFEAENTTILFAKSSDTVVNAFYHGGGALIREYMQSILIIKDISSNV